MHAVAKLLQRTQTGANREDRSFPRERVTLQPSGAVIVGNSTIELVANRPLGEFTKDLVMSSTPTASDMLTRRIFAFGGLSQPSLESVVDATKKDGAWSIRR